MVLDKAITLSIKHFYMIRHGQTVANAQGYASGSMDTPLTEKGREQALAVIPVLECLSLKPVLIVYSALSRARDTATLLNSTMELPMKENALLGEQSFGDWVGTSWSEVSQWLEQDKDPPNGETRDVFIRRVMKGIAEVMKLTEEPVLVVSHGGVFDALMQHFGKQTIAVKNCHLYEFVPWESTSPFPWKVWHYDLSPQGKITRHSLDV